MILPSNFTATFRTSVYIPRPSAVDKGIVVTTPRNIVLPYSYPVRKNIAHVV